jgi:GTP-binding protein
VQTDKGTYTLLDTGGIGLTVDMSQKQLVAAAEEQVFIAAQAATLICLVVDARDGLTPLDEMIAQRLRSFGKTPLLVINKVDSEKVEPRAAEFARLGLGSGITVSAEHGYGEDDLRAAILERLPEIPADELAPAEFDENGLRKVPQRRIRISFVGRPNVGKSSLCNALLKSERLVVSEVPGTTRDAIELDLDFKAPDGSTWPFRLVDTAGLRRKVRIDTPVEYFSSLRSQEAIAKSDVVFVVIDAMEGITKQEQALLGEVIKTAPSVALLVNKWDFARAQVQGGCAGRRRLRGRARLPREIRGSRAQGALLPARQPRPLRLGQDRLLRRERAAHRACS